MGKAVGYHSVVIAATVIGVDVSVFVPSRLMMEY